MSVGKIPLLVSALVLASTLPQAVSANTWTNTDVYQKMRFAVGWHIQQGVFWWFIPTSYGGFYKPDEHDWVWSALPSMGPGWAQSQYESVLVTPLMMAWEENLMPNKLPPVLSTYKGIPIPAQEWPQAFNNAVEDLLTTQAEDGAWQINVWPGSTKPPVGQSENVGATACGVIMACKYIMAYEQGKWNPPSKDEITSLVEAARKGVVWLLETQNDDGSWPGHPEDRNRVSSGWYTVAACDALFYALMNAGYLGLTEADVAMIKQALVRGINWLISNQQPDGAFPANIMGTSTTPDTQSYIIELLANAYKYDDELGLGLDKNKLLEAIKKAVHWLFWGSVSQDQANSYEWIVRQFDEGSTGTKETFCGPDSAICWVEVDVKDSYGNTIETAYGPGWAWTKDDLTNEYGDDYRPETTVTGNVLSHALLLLYYYGIATDVQIMVPNPDGKGFKVIPLSQLFDPNSKYNIYATIQWFMNQHWCSTLQGVSWYGGWPWPNMGVHETPWSASPNQPSAFATSYVMRALEAFYDPDTYYGGLQYKPPVNSSEPSLQREITEYKITMLEAEINELEDKIHSLDQEISNLGSNVSYNTNSIRTLQAQVSGIRNDVNDIKQQLSNLKNEISDLKNQVSQNSSSINSMNQRIQSISSEVSDLKQKINEIENEINDIKNDIDNLKNSVDNLKTTLSDLEETVNKLQQQSQSQQTSSSGSQISSEEAEKIESEINQLKNELSNLSNSVDELESKVQKLESEISSINGEVSVNTSDINGIKEDISKVKSLINSLEQSLNEVQEQVKANQGDISNVKSELSKLSESVNDLESVVDSLSKKVMDLQAKLSTGVSPEMFNVYMSKVNELEKKVQELENEIRELKVSSQSSSEIRVMSKGPTGTSSAEKRPSGGHGVPVFPLVIVAALAASLRGRR